MKRALNDSLAGTPNLKMALLGASLVTSALAVSTVADAQTVHTANVKLPGESVVRPVPYQVRAGLAMYEGDVILGRVDASGQLIQHSVGIRSITAPEGALWPDGLIPYRVDGDWGRDTTTMNSRVQAAITHWQERTGLRFVRYNPNVHQGFVSIVHASDDDHCSAGTGFNNGMQLMLLGRNCLERTVIHEFGHIVGLHHEATRSDRDQYVKILWDKIDKNKRHNFCRRAGAPYSELEKQHCAGLAPQGGIERFSSYDYDSIMHYASSAFPREDLPDGTITIERLLPGNIDDNRELSESDVASVERLYSFASSSQAIQLCAASGEVCATGDFNADGHQDLISFHHGAYGGSSDVMVSLSNGSGGYLVPQRWATGFCGRTDEVCKVGDFDGNGTDDIITFHHGAFGSSGLVFVYLSNGANAFTYTGKPWAEKFCGLSQEVCDVGDFNEDGADDIITFHHGAFNNSSTVFVYLSDRSKFNYPGAPWQQSFCHAGMKCGVGDVDGDGRADAVAFFQDVYSDLSNRDVWVAASTGSKFLAPAKWHDDFCGPLDLCLLGDVNGDGRADAVSILGRLASSGGTPARTQAILSTGSSFAGHVYDGLSRCGVRASCGLADMDEDGRADVFSYQLRNNMLWIARSQHE